MTSTPKPTGSQRRFSTRARGLLRSLSGRSAESSSWWLVAGGGVTLGMIGLAGPGLPGAALHVPVILGLVGFFAGLSLGLVVAVGTVHDARSSRGWEKLHGRRRRGPTRTFGEFCSWIFLALGGLLFSIAGLLFWPLLRATP